jgi:alpha-glucosidase
LHPGLFFGAIGRGKAPVGRRQGDRGNARFVPRFASHPERLPVCQPRRFTLSRVNADIAGHARPQSRRQGMAGNDWWKGGVIYQIYPRSFMDSNGDGIGDLAGITARLDHLSGLGIDAIWISPIFPSPMADFGYDISDYCAIDPMFGTMADFDALLAAAHARGLRVLLDLVPGHTSDRHPWFQDSRSARDAARRDWYVWHDPAPDGGPPNNWISEFGGPAWTLDAASGQYYLHIFLPEQPTLNWRNPAVAKAIADAMRFWFDRGVDGFRVDAFENLVVDAAFCDNPPNPDWTPPLGPARSLLGKRTKHQPELIGIAQTMRRIAAEYTPERLLIGEAYGDLDEVVRYYGPALDGFQQPFNFQLIGLDWTPEVVAQVISGYEAALPEGAWPNWVLGNHDRARVASRVGLAQARVAMTLLLTLRGTPTIYQGDELGMENVAIPPDRVQDPWEVNVPGHGLGRDPVRTPIAWAAGPGAGFTTGAPWLPIDTRPAVTVAHQQDDPHAMLGYTRRLLALRRAEPALAQGDIHVLHADDCVLAYRRAAPDGGAGLAIALNFSDRPQPLPDGLAGEMLLSSAELVPPAAGPLAPNEARVLRLAEG